MNKKQRNVLIAVAVVVLAMLLYPPWQLKLSEGRVFGRGFGWLFAPSDPRATVDVGLLIAEWIGVLIVGGIAYLMLKDR